MNEDYNYNIDQMYIDIEMINFKQSKDSIKYFHHMGCDIKICECELLGGSNFEKVPKTFYDSKVINIIIKNRDQKCFLHCYIRKYLNPVVKHGERVSKLIKI